MQICEKVKFLKPTGTYLHITPEDPLGPPLSWMWSFFYRKYFLKYSLCPPLNLSSFYTTRKGTCQSHPYIPDSEPSRGPAEIWAGQPSHMPSPSPSWTVVQRIVWDFLPKLNAHCTYPLYSTGQCTGFDWGCYRIWAGPSRASPDCLLEPVGTF